MPYHYVICYFISKCLRCCCCVNSGGNGFLSEAREMFPHRVKRVDTQHPLHQNKSCLSMKPRREYK